MKKITFAFIFCLTSLMGFSQSIVVSSGSIGCLGQEKALNFVFTYDNMIVGKMNETEYVEKKVIDNNKEKEGQGNEWHKAWLTNRGERFEPKFKELFDKYMEGKIVSGADSANYTLVVNTVFTEPGFNVGVMRRNASIDLDCSLIENATKKEVAHIKIKNASANSFWGADFTGGFRIQETYGVAGRELAKFIIKKNKMK